MLPQGSRKRILVRLWYVGACAGSADPDRRPRHHLPQVQALAWAWRQEQERAPGWLLLRVPKDQAWEGLEAWAERPPVRAWEEPEAWAEQPPVRAWEGPEAWARQPVQLCWALPKQLRLAAQQEPAV